MIDALSGLRRFVSRPGLARGERHARVIAVTAQKGGVGKTTTAVHLAAGLALDSGKKVLLIDMDAQGHVAMSLRQLFAPITQDTLGAILLGKKRDVYEIAQRTRLDGLWIVPSDRELNTTESIMASRIGKELLLRKALEVARTHFDVIVIDCPPNLGSLTVNALVAADLLLVPGDLSLLSLDGIEALLDAMETVRDTLNPGLGLLGLLRTRVDRRNQTVNGAIGDVLTERYGSVLLETEIGVSTDIAKAQLEGCPVFELKKDSRGAQAYRALAAEVTARLAAPAARH